MGKNKAVLESLSGTAFLILKFINFTNLIFKVILGLFSDVHIDLCCYITFSVTNAFLDYSQWNIHICQDRNMSVAKVVSSNVFVDLLSFNSSLQILIGVVNIKRLLLVISCCCLVDGKQQSTLAFPFGMLFNDIGSGRRKSDGS